jgi:uncharacterized protein (TIGR00369 family)
MSPLPVTAFAGVEFLEAFRRGHFPWPPLIEFLGMEAVEFERGRAVFASTPREEHYSVLGRVHGGVIATLLDTALGCAVHTCLAPGERYATTELSVNFIRPLDVETGRVLCTGEVLHIGRTIATAQGHLVSEATGKLIAHAKATLVVSRPE